MTKNLLLTGRPGIGKTTIIKGLAKGLNDLKPSGFYTEEIKDRGIRTGSTIKRLNGMAVGILASTHIKSPRRIGKYRVDIEVFEGFLEEIEKEIESSGVILIDEIGKMECLSKRFEILIESILSSHKILVATIAEKGKGFIESVKKRRDVFIFEITEQNREILPSDVERLVREMVGTGGFEPPTSTVSN